MCKYLPAEGVHPRRAVLVKVRPPSHFKLSTAPPPKIPFLPYPSLLTKIPQDTHKPIHKPMHTPIHTRAHTHTHTHTHAHAHTHGAEAIMTTMTRNKRVIKWMLNQTFWVSLRIYRRLLWEFFM